MAKPKRAPKHKPLNDRQVRFCQGIVEGLTNGEAYMRAGFRAKGHSAASAGERLLKKVEKHPYLEELREKCKSKAIMTAVQAKEALTRLMKGAEADCDYHGFVALANRMAKMEAWDSPERIEQDVKVVIGGDAD